MQTSIDRVAELLCVNRSTIERLLDRRKLVITKSAVSGTERQE